jgi:multiple sugar transport system substrate-binding protein
MNYLAICGLMGADLSGEGEVLVPREVGLAAIEVHRRLVALTPPEALDWSSIKALDAMVARDDLAYCPMVFCFNSYSRPSPGGRPRLAYSDLPDFGAAGAGSVVGGAGLGVSALRPNREAALVAVRHLMTAEAQQRIAVAGGQPGRASVWRDAEADRANGGFFSACLGPMTRSKVRPRHAGYMALQNGAGALLREDAAGRPTSAAGLYEAIEALHRAARSS